MFPWVSRPTLAVFHVVQYRIWLISPATSDSDIQAPQELSYVHRDAWSGTQDISILGPPRVQGWGWLCLATRQWASRRDRGLLQGCVLLACAPQIAYRSSACNTIRCRLPSRDQAAARGCSRCTGSMPAPRNLRVKTLNQVVVLFTSQCRLRVIAF